ncbi:MAG: hypothetical protein OWS74_07335 [Firmicutes bacterium]|nr:hypothetical protein [Bacillota bacterium]
MVKKMSEEQVKEINFNKLVFLDLGCALSWAKPRFILYYVPSFSSFVVGKGKRGKVSVLHYLVFLATKNYNLGIYPLPHCQSTSPVTWGSGRIVEVRNMRLHFDVGGEFPIHIKYSVNGEERAFSLSQEVWEGLTTILPHHEIVGVIDSLLYPPPS